MEKLGTSSVLNVLNRLPEFLGYLMQVQLKLRTVG